MLPKMVVSEVNDVTGDTKDKGVPGGNEVTDKSRAPYLLSRKNRI
jgi:hypothetical protein